MQVKSVCATLSLLSGLAREKRLPPSRMSVKDDAADHMHGSAISQVTASSDGKFPEGDLGGVTGCTSTIRAFPASRSVLALWQPARTTPLLTGGAIPTLNSRPAADVETTAAR